MSVIGALTGNLIDLLADLGEGIISVFENPKAAIESFKTLIVENIQNRFNAIFDTVGYLGKAIKLLFEGEFRAALKVGKQAANSFVDSMTGVENSIGKASGALSGFAKEQMDEAKAAASAADMRAKADKIERKLVVDRSKLESEIALLKLKSRQEDEFTAQERQAALLKAQELEESLLDKETEYLELRRDAQVLENTFSRSNKENLDKEAQAIAEVNRVVARRADNARATQRELNRVSKEIERDENEKAKAEETKQLEEQKKEALRLEGIQKIQDEFKKKQDEKDAETQLQKAELEETNKLAELEKLSATEEQKQAIRDYYADVKIEAEKADAAASKAIDDQALADKIAIIQAEQSAREANVATIANGLNGLQNVFKAFGKENKALAIASIIVDQVASISRIISSTAIANAKAVELSPVTFGMPWVTINSLSAGASIAGSVAGAAKAISALKSDKPTPTTSSSIPSSGGGGSAPAPAITAPSAPPSFNVVGASDSSQLAGVIANQSQQPIQAYVVSNDVTTAQSLDRNIIESVGI
jgi:chemotaxis protein histidine kinase CheA